MQRNKLSFYSTNFTNIRQRPKEMDVVDYIKNFTLTQLREANAFNNGQLIYVLNMMDNPMAVGAVKVWLSIRRERMHFEQTIFAKIKRVRREVDKLFALKEKIAKKKLGAAMYAQL